jgi:hypothetical protein
LFALLACCGFLALMVARDITPNGALYRIGTRFGRVPERLKPALSDAPYRRIAQAPAGGHRPLLLNIETSDGSGQACHPDVAYAAEGFGSEGWTYWMACTPYPYGEAAYENPEVFASFDGVNWIVPPGLTNPVVSPPGARNDHNSDPDILFFQGELWLYYRETLRSKTPNENRILLTRSKDGALWSPRAQVLRDVSGREILSPAVIHDGHQFVMWTVEVIDGTCHIVRRFSRDGVGWDVPITGIVSGLELPRHAWHIDVIQERDRLSALIVSCVGLGGAKSRLHYGYSLDGGLNWIVQGFLFDQVYEFESDAQYRATSRFYEECAPAYEVWYSARNRKMMFSIGYLRMIRQQNDLIPAGRAVISNISSKQSQPVIS